MMCIACGCPIEDGEPRHNLGPDGCAHVGREACEAAQAKGEDVSTDLVPRCWCGARAYTGSCTASDFHDPTATGRPDTIRKLYLAGPMSGRDNCNYPAFHMVAEELRSVGFEVVNPAEHAEGRHYVDFIRRDIKLLVECDGVAVLEEWWESVGARNEAQVAGILHMPVRPWQQWLELGPQEGGKPALQAAAR